MLRVASLRAMISSRSDSLPASAGLSRRDFTKLLTFGGSAAWLAGASALRGEIAPPALPPLPPTPARPDEAFWRAVRAQFVMPPTVSVMNAANLCPSPWPVLQTLYEKTRDMDRDPSHENRVAMTEGKEAARRVVAEFLRATPEEIILTRNTSESNNLVSLGLELREGDEIVLFSDNHPSNKAAWEIRRKRYGFTIVEIPVVNPHPGPEHYLEAVRKVFTSRTRLLAFTHHTNTVGDLFPAKALCQLAREHDVLTLVDGAQSFGLLDVDLGDMQPDFYSGSGHKWPCGPKEVGVLYVSRHAQDRLWPGVVSAGAGAVGISKTHEAFGQRDEPAIIAFAEALKFQMQLGRPAIETRSRELGQALIAGLHEIAGVTLWTHSDPDRSVCVVVFKPGELDPAKLAETLYRREGIGCTARTGKDRPGLRISPHFYNLREEVDRAVASIGKYMKDGLA